MGFNIDIFFDFIGRLKLATVVVGFMDLILIAISYHAHDFREELFLSAVVLCLVFSSLWVFGVMFEFISITDTFIRLDMVYHVVACLALAFTDILFLISLLKYGTHEAYFGSRILGMVFGFINSSIYGYLPWTLLKTP